MAEREAAESRGPAQSVTVKGTHQRGGMKKEGKRGGEARPTSQKEEGSTQNMVVSYLVLIVRLDSFWSTSHVALPCD